MARGYVREQLWTPEGAPAEQFYRRAGLGARRAPRVAPVGRAGDGRLREGRSREGPARRVRRPGPRVPDASRSARSWSRAATRSAIETWQRWREPGRGRGHGLLPAPEYQVFPTRERPLKPYEAAVLAAQVDARVRARVRARRGGLGHPHAARRRWPPSSRACRSRRSFRTSTRTSRPGSRRSRSARGGRARGVGARALAADATGWWPSGSSRGGREYNDCRARLGLAAAAVGAHRALALADDGRRRCRSSSTRARGRRGCASSGRCCGSRAARCRRRRRATGPSCWSRRRPRRIPRDRCCGRPGRAGGRAGARDRDRRAGAVVAAPANAVARALDVLRADDAALRPRDHPRRPRDAGARAGARLPGGGVPGRGRHGRERRAGRLGGRGRAARAALLHAVGRAAGGAAGARATGTALAGGAVAAGRSRIPVPPPPRPSWSAGRRRWAWIRRGRSRRRGRCGRVRLGVSTDEQALRLEAPPTNAAIEAVARGDAAVFVRSSPGAKVSRRAHQRPLTHSTPATRPTTSRANARGTSCAAAPRTDGEAHTRREPPGAALVLARGVGLEPTTLRLTAECSAD